MQKYVYSFLLTFALDAVVLAQTSNSKYEVTIFGAPPAGQRVWNLPRSVAADGKGSIILLRASDPAVLIYNRDGKLQTSWGNGLFKEAHSVDLDRDGFLWITDRADNMVYKFTIDGKQLMALGKKGVAGDNNSTDSFNGASDIAIAPDGDCFVSEGQDVIGTLQSRPHNVALDPTTGILYFADPITPLYAGTEAIAVGVNRAPGRLFQTNHKEKITNGLRRVDSDETLRTCFTGRLSFLSEQCLEPDWDVR